MTRPAIIAYESTPLSDSTIVGGVSVGDGTGGAAGQVPVSNGDDTATWTDLEAAVAALGRFLETIGGGKGRVASLGSLGAVFTADVGLGNWLWGTLDDDVDLDFSGLTNLRDCEWLLELIEDGTGGHTPNMLGITWLTSDGSPPLHDTTALSRSFYVFLTRDGGTTIYGRAASADALVAALDDLTDVVVTAPAAADRLRFDGALWRNSALVWRPAMVLDPVSGNYLPMTTGGGDAVMVEA